MTREIRLTKGYVAVVDDFDWWFVRSRGPWHVGNTDRPTIHARTKTKDPSGVWRHVFMHQLLLPGATLVDHINGDGLDNRRSNLRAADLSQNAGNARRRRDNTSGYRGVSTCGGRIQAHLAHSHLGSFQTVEEAARAYDIAALERWGEYARTNFPREDYSS